MCNIVLSLSPTTFIPWSAIFFVLLVQFSNSFVNFVVYFLRFPRYRKALLSSVHVACSAGGFGGLSSVLPPFWIRCRLGGLGQEWQNVPPTICKLFTSLQFSTVFLFQDGSLNIRWNIRWKYIKVWKGLKALSTGWTLGSRYKTIQVCAYFALIMMALPATLFSMAWYKIVMQR